MLICVPYQSLLHELVVYTKLCAIQTHPKQLFIHIQNSRTRFFASKMSNSHVTAQEVDILSQKAILAKETAYCLSAILNKPNEKIVLSPLLGPYSKFRVGACVLTENGEYITGANVENASYPVGLCAERCAISTAVAAGYKKFKAIAIATDIEPAASPCGMCRQFMREFFHSCLPVFLYDKNAKYIRTAMGQILPGSFGPEHLIEK